MIKIRYICIKLVAAALIICSYKDSKGQNRHITLDGAILMAQKNSLDYKLAFNQYQSDLWNFKNFQSLFLPTLVLEGTIPSYTRSINRITLPSGEDAFVAQNQSFSSLNLGLRQRIAATGGIVSMNTVLDRIDIFGRSRQGSYSVVPFSISYVQNTIGFNDFRWTKRTEPLRFELSKRQLQNSMESVAYQAIDNYFETIASQDQQLLTRQNLINGQNLLRIAQERFKLGTVPQSELLQLRLNILNAQNRVREDSISFVLAKQKFSTYLDAKDENWELEIPDKINFYRIRFEDALEKANENGQEVIAFRLKRIEAERRLAQTKAANGLKFNIQANFGVSNTSPSFSSLLNNLANQQNISLGFTLPLLDWGLAKTQRLRAEADLSIAKNQNDQKQREVEQEISLQVAKWNMHQLVFQTTVEAKDIADKNYNLEMQRYLKGSISINDLNVAQNQKDATSASYIQVVKKYWQLLYTIRRLTLYDFEKNEKITLLKQ